MATGVAAGANGLSQTSAKPDQRAPILTIHDLNVQFTTPMGIVRAVEGLSYSVRPGEMVAIVGESGSGKSVMSMSIMQLIATPPGRFAGGRIVFDGADLLTKSEREMRRIRGQRSNRIVDILGHAYGSEVVHRNNLVLL